MTDTKPPRVRIVSRGGLASTSVYVDGVLLPGVVRVTWAADASSSRTVATLDILDVEVDIATRDVRSRLHAVDIAATGVDDDQAPADGGRE